MEPCDLVVSRTGISGMPGCDKGSAGLPSAASQQFLLWRDGKLLVLAASRSLQSDMQAWRQRLRGCDGNHNGRSD